MDRSSLIVLAGLSLVITLVFGMAIAAQFGWEGTQVGGGLLWEGVEIPTQLCLVCPVVFVVLALLFIAMTPRYR